MGLTGKGIVIGTGVCWVYMFIGTGMKTGIGTGTITTFTFSSPVEELTEDRVRAGGGRERSQKLDKERWEKMIKQGIVTVRQEIIQNFPFYVFN